MDQGSAAALKPFLRRVAQHFAPVRFILFGSRARADHLKESDYDLVVISPRFAGVGVLERHIEVYKLQRERLDIDLVCLTPEEFKTRATEMSVIGEAAREGVELAI